MSWSCLGSVEVSERWLDKAIWPAVKGGQPNRVHIPAEVRQCIETILGWFGRPVTYKEHYACLSRLVPGQSYEFHRDPQPPNWITRVHVPIKTNPGAWLMFASEGAKVHFEVGHAYSFDTLQLHSFGNDGAEDRVHLLFDVLDDS